MPTLHRFANAAIRMYAGDHGVPHFHVETPDERCSVTIVTLEILAGHVPARIQAAALAWARENRALLMAKWKELNK